MFYLRPVDEWACEPDSRCVGDGLARWAGSRRAADGGEYRPLSAGVSVS